MSGGATVTLRGIGRRRRRRADHRLPLVAKPATDPLVHGGGESGGGVAERPARDERRLLLLLGVLLFPAPASTSSSAPAAADPPAHVDVPVKQQHDQGVNAGVAPRDKRQQLVYLKYESGQSATSIDGERYYACH